MLGFLSSGLFLGWSLGANDASNVFGTAVASRMIRFRTAAIYCSIFVIFGAVVSGAGATQTLGRLGAVNAVAGAFIVAFAAAMSVYLMTLARFPVSTSQAIVGAIIGWNMFSGSLTDMTSLTRIVSTWIFCPLLSAGFAMILYLLAGFVVQRCRIHMFKLDALTRWSLLCAGIFGSYSLGANNIANVMGVFVPVAHLDNISFFGCTFSAAQQLFLLGGLAIALGVFTFSKRVMLTVGRGIFDLSPVMATVVVWSHSIVLFLFSSVALESWLKGHGLPSFPLVPVSSSQAIVGAVIGIGILKGGKNIRWKTVAGIAGSWVTTPIIAALLCLVSLFFLQNVFQQETFRQVRYRLDNDALNRIEKAGIEIKNMPALTGKQYPNAIAFKKALLKAAPLEKKTLAYVMKTAEVDNLQITPEKIQQIKPDSMNAAQFQSLEQLTGRVFAHRWLFNASLAKQGLAFQFIDGNTQHNADLHSLLNKLYIHFRIRKYR